ncbi:hypothetical protein [Nocardiopsis rhodophaea]
MVSPPSGVNAERLAELRSQVEPAAVSRQEACAFAAASQDVAYDPDDAMLFSDNMDAGIVAVASSSDPVHTAFGRAMFDGAEINEERFFRAVRRYCSQGEARN